MPLQPEKVLKELADATEEAKKTLQEVHQARKELLEVQKKERNRISSLLVDEISAQVGSLKESAYKEMIEKANDILERLEEDWRKKLGLNDA